MSVIEPTPGELLIAGMQRLLAPRAAQRGILNAPAAFEATVLPTLRAGLAPGRGAGTSGALSVASDHQSSLAAPSTRQRGQSSGADSSVSPSAPDALSPASVRGRTPQQVRQPGRPFGEDAGDSAAGADAMGPEIQSSAGTSHDGAVQIPGIPRIRRTGSSNGQAQRTGSLGSGLSSSSSSSSLSSRQVVAANRLGMRMALRATPSPDPGGEPAWLHAVRLVLGRGTTKGTREALTVSLSASSLLQPVWWPTGVAVAGRAGSRPGTTRGSASAASLDARNYAVTSRETGMIDWIARASSGFRSHGAAMSSVIARDEVEAHHELIGFFS